MMQQNGAMPPPPQNQWPAVPPQYYQQPLPPMRNQQPSQIPPPAAAAVPSATAPYQIPTNYAMAPAQGGSDEIRTLWIGDLQYWMDETFVSGCFNQTGEVVSVKLIRNKQTGQLEGYGFIEFATRATAERVLQSYNGALMPNTDQAFRLNWASFGAGEKRGSDGNDYTIFVGDLAADVTDYVLQETFRSHYPSVKGAKVVTDRTTGRPKGYGFVRFGDVNEQTRAIAEMNGMYCSTRPMRVGAAANKKAAEGQQQFSANGSYQNTQGAQSDSDPDNTTIFVGGLDTNASDEQLRQLFSTYGELINVKIPMGKRCAFVQFRNRACAEEALLMLNGTLVGSQNIRLSWGRSLSNKQQDVNQLNGNNNQGYGQQSYNAYGYGQAPQDPNMYAYGAAYPGYPNYQQPQDVNYQQQQ